MRRVLFLLSFAVMVWVVWGFVRDGGRRALGTDSYQAATASALPRAEAAAQLRVEVPPPPFSEGVFPCSDCHNQKDLPPNRTRRKLEDAHDDIVLKHDEEHRWCLDCHDADNRDRLHLASGEAVPFEESYQVCGQCHGEKYRDWRAGVHGRRIGDWNGAKQYLLCVHCHSPHQPRFKPLAPQPAPHPPMRTAR
jgi:Cytochrome c7 and related cytochrome c